jgi:hypothetical protein
MGRMGRPRLIGESHVAAPAPILVTATIRERDPTALDVCAGVFVREFSRRTGAIRYGAIRLRM